MCRILEWLVMFCAGFVVSLADGALFALSHGAPFLKETRSLYEPTGSHPRPEAAGNLIVVAEDNARQAPSQLSETPTDRSNGVMDAIKQGRLEEVRQLLDEGADPNQRSRDGETPLTLAVWHRRVNIVRLLLERGADANVRDGRGNPALLLAADRGNTRAVKHLLDKGADVNSRNQLEMTPLMLASLKGYRSIVRLLLRRGADVNARTVNGFTALSQAERKQQTDVIRILKAYGAED